MSNFHNIVKVCIAGSILLASTSVLAVSKEHSTGSDLSTVCSKTCWGEVTVSKPHLMEQAATLRIGTEKVAARFGRPVESLKPGEIVVIGAEKAKVLEIKRHGDVFSFKLEPISSTGHEVGTTRAYK